MENSERNFEFQWQLAFAGAEASPPQGTWLAIENSLNIIENDRNKRRVFFYQKLAATLLLICAATALTTLWITRDPGVTISAPGKLSVNDAGKSSDTGEQNAGQGSSNSSAGAGQTGKEKRAGQIAITSARKVTNSTPASVNPGVSSREITSEPPGNVDVADAVVADSSTADPKVASHTLTEAEEKEIVKKLLGKEKDESVIPQLTHPAWASFGLAGGSYAPYSSVNSGGTYAALDQRAAGTSSMSATPATKPKPIGSSYSIGFMVGKQLGRKWMLQTGLNYLVQRVDYESDVVANSAGALSAFEFGFAKADYNTTSYAYTNPYTISSTSEFLSLPVQIGYIFLDRKTGIILHTGVSTDYFLRNTLTDRSGSLGSSTQSGDESVFHTFSWAGLGNAEFSYRIGDHYRLSLVPGIRYSFTSRIKEESGSIKPVVFDVGFRFRYTFK